MQSDEKISFLLTTAVNNICLNSNHSILHARQFSKGFVSTAAYLLVKSTPVLWTPSFLHL